ncbi:MAG: LysM peptidoglycan-binding domain-containing protein [Opitutaceae bacterium]|jgi:LysM repeat protein|nr:LysM peptidoglycan-binding domain-containing protein [Opitutaceae bacterium]
MDPISREPSPSYLPIAGLIAGLVGLLLGGIALANASKANKAVTEAQAALATQSERINGFDSSIAAAQSTAESARSSSTKLVGEVNSAFQQVATEMAKINGEIAKLQEAASKGGAAKAGAAKSTEPAVAGPGEYVIKSGDTFAKIARAQGVSLADIQSVNPGVDPSKLKVGQKIKLPKK